jgi:hypothetical protein
VVAVLALALSLGGAAYATTAFGGSSNVTNAMTFQSLTLVNGWVSEQGVYASGNPGVSISGGVVYLRGSLAQPTLGSDVFATLPAAYAPPHNLYITVYTSSDTSGTLHIAPDGLMEAFSGTPCDSGNTAQCFTSLATVSYPKNS